MAQKLVYLMAVGQLVLALTVLIQPVTAQNNVYIAEVERLVHQIQIAVLCRQNAVLIAMEKKCVPLVAPDLPVQQTLNVKTKQSAEAQSTTQPAQFTEPERIVILPLLPLTARHWDALVIITGKRFAFLVVRWALVIQTLNANTIQHSAQVQPTTQPA